MRSDREIAESKVLVERAGLRVEGQAARRTAVEGIGQCSEQGAGGIGTPLQRRLGIEHCAVGEAPKRDRRLCAIECERARVLRCDIALRIAGTDPDGVDAIGAAVECEHSLDREAAAGIEHQVHR